MERTFQPAQPRLVALFGAVAVVSVLLFTLILSASLQLVQKTGTDGYYDFYLPEFKSFVSVAQEGERLILTGYAYLEDDKIETVDNVVVIKNQETGQYLSLPTQMVQDESINEAIDSEYDYSSAGFYASVYLWQLDAPLSDYKIYISYHTNNGNGLLDTFERLEDVA